MTQLQIIYVLFMLHRWTYDQFCNSFLKPLNIQETVESTKKDKENDGTPGEPKRGSGEGPLQRGFYQEHKQGSCPVHGHSTSAGASSSSSSEPPRSHSLHVRGDPALASKIASPGEYKRMFLPAHEVPVLHPYLVHAPRDAPYPLHPLDERHAEIVRERERQVGLFNALLKYVISLGWNCVSCNDPLVTTDVRVLVDAIG